MLNIPGFDFDFDFEGESRDLLLSEASETFSSGVLGEYTTVQTPDQTAAQQVLSRLKQQIAKFGAHPEVYELEEKHFSEHGLPIPVRFKDISKDHHVYWINFPIMMHRQEENAFNKIKVRVEFNPGEAEAHLRPRTLTMLPHSKFQDLFATQGEAKLGLDAELEFEAKTSTINTLVPTAGGQVDSSGGLTADNVSRLGLLSLPFEYRLRAEQIENSGTNAAQAYWMVSGGQFFQENLPKFIVVLQVPKDVQTVRVTAALQAYTEITLSSDELQDSRDKLVRFFRAGAPVEDLKGPEDWVITRNF
jgi:hypothetical protein